MSSKTSASPRRVVSIPLAAQDHVLVNGAVTHGPYPGTDAGFASFFADHYVALKRAIYLLCGRPEDSADVVQEAMACVYERWERVCRMASPAAYVFTVARNELRRRMRRDRWLVWAGTGRVLSTAADDPQDEVRTRIDVRRALALLHQAGREALVLVDYLGFTPTEAAHIVGTTPGTLRVRLHRARAQFRRLVGGTGG